MTETIPSEHHGHRAPRARGLIAFVAVAALALASVALYFSGPNSSRALTRSLVVNGSGTATSVPDTVIFQLSVNTVRANAGEALKVNNLRVKALMAALEAQKVTKRDIQTSNFNIYQSTNQYGAPTGFTVSDSLQVTMHDIKRAGGAIDAAVAAVGNGVSFNGVSFSQSHQSSVLAQARAKAMRAAHTAAADLASAAGVSLGAPIKIVDQENQVSPPYPIMYGGAVATSGKATVSTNLSPGTQSVTVQVSVTYQVTS
ncbi:MAG TPA: SIMPL domain-containing protein [Acidimicrobiales bacterium]|nr:SIMPL domain-containing protein [Acidimicrobiales bacterium]